MFYAQFPSFSVTMLSARALSDGGVLEGFLWGISVQGWLLLGVMGLSFVQWFAVGSLWDLIARKLRKDDGRPEQGRLGAPQS